MDEPVEQRLLNFWRHSGAAPRAGASVADLRECESRIGRVLPTEVAKFYRCANGTEETTDWLFETWPLARLGKGLVLIDAGMASDGTDVDVGLKALGESAGAIQAILLTHWHNDHAAGAAAVHERTGAPVFYHAGDEPYLTGRTRRTGVRGWMSDAIPEAGVLVLLKGLLGESTPRPVSAFQHVGDP